MRLRAEVLCLDRWPALQAALCAPTQHVALLNRFALGSVPEYLQGAPDLQLHPGLTLKRYPGATGPFPLPAGTGPQRLLDVYWLDAASVLPALVLNCQRGDHVLDMCAAPGGKSLLLAHLLLLTPPGSSPGCDPAQQQAGQTLCMQLPDPSVATVDCQAAAGASFTGVRPVETPACNIQDDSDSKPPVATAVRGKDSVEVDMDAGRSLCERDHQTKSSAGLGAVPVAPVTTAASPLDHTSRAAELRRLRAGRLVCNEADSRRRQRLTRVLWQYLPPDTTEEQVTVVGRDAAVWWRQKEGGTFDRILVDAPCSSDRHVLQQATLGALPGAASPQSIKKLPDLQAKLITAAYYALKPGGTLVYSTCSIFRAQNDDVVATCVSRLSGLQVASHSDGALRAVAAAVSKLQAERTLHGWLVLPDRGGHGPIYFAVLLKSE